MIDRDQWGIKKTKNKQNLIAIIIFISFAVPIQPLWTAYALRQLVLEGYWFELIIIGNLWGAFGN